MHSRVGLVAWPNLVLDVTHFRVKNSLWKSPQVCGLGRARGWTHVSALQALVLPTSPMLCCLKHWHPSQLSLTSLVEAILLNVRVSRLHTSMGETNQPDALENISLFRNKRSNPSLHQKILEILSKFHCEHENQNHKLCKVINFVEHIIVKRNIYQFEKHFQNSYKFNWA